MAKSQMEQAAGLYANLMSEVKVRIAFIGTVANGHHVHAWASKIIGLLEQHVMLSKDHDRSVVCVMNDPSAGGQVRVVAAVAATPSPPPV